MVTSFVYSIPYVIALILVFAVVIRDINWTSRGLEKNTRIRITLISFYILFIGFRGFLHTDWVVYYPEFQRLPTLWNINMSNINDIVWEPGFALYSIIIKSIFPSYFFWTFIGTLIDIIIMDYLLKKNLKYYALGFIFFYSFFTMYEINLLRNTKSIMLFLISLKSVEENKIWRYLLINLIGVTFHSSSLLYLFIYPILKIRFSNVFILSLFFVGIVVYIFQVPWCSGIISLIADINFSNLWKLLMHMDSSSSNIISIGFLERTFTFLFLFFHRNKIENHNYFGHIMYNCYLLYFFSYFYFSEFSVLSDRFSVLFILSYCFVYPIVFQYMNKGRLLYVVLMFMYMFMKELFGNRDILNKYNNVLFGIESYDERINDALQSKPYLENRYYYQLYK